MISKVHQKLVEKFKNKEFFDQFFRQRVQDEIALGIQELRDARALRQSDLAELCSMKQAAISRIEKADYASWNFQTLLRVAKALDARLQVVFKPREEVIKSYQEKEWESEENERIKSEATDVGVETTYKIGGLVTHGFGEELFQGKLNIPVVELFNQFLNLVS